eukprot:SAG11_NODE_9070_length_947_cov_1.158019_2_plen_24_part_01
MLLREQLSQKEVELRAELRAAQER